MIFCGPTGSGKTVSFYTSLRQLEDQLLSIEDPLAIEMPSILQLEVQDRQGHRFADLSREVPDADPDVVLLGEIQGEEIAQYAFKMATTGHLVMSVIHT
jgi:type II secretory ATPase GspE/PulE/Tfp pilus assembly ATPase PilB-like protein